MKDSKLFIIFLYSVLGIFILGFFFLVVCIIFKVIPAENKDLLTYLCATLTAGVLMVLHFLVGNTKDSQKTNEMLYNSTPIPPQVESVINDVEQQIKS